MVDLSLDTLMNLIDKYPDNLMGIKHNYLLLLSNLTLTSFLDTDLFMNNIKKISAMGAIYILYKSVPNKEDFTIVASGTIIVEPKIFREGKNVGHIEDIVVSQTMQHKGLCKIILNSLKTYARENNCYKVILECKNELKPIYKKNGFQVKGVQMAEYFV